MAGIGFTLRKVMGERRLSSVAFASIAGLFIVAGPWFFSMANMALAAFNLGNVADASGSMLLFGLIIYGYSISLILAAPFHYLLTRIVADLVYENREAATSRYLLQFLPIGVMAGLAAGLWVLGIAGGGGPARDPAFVAAWLMFCVGTNITWLAMINVSLLRWYKRLLLAFVLVLSCSAAALLPSWSTSGLTWPMMVLGAGNLILGILLTILCLVAYPPKVNRREHRTRAAFEQSWRLVLGGWLLSVNLWFEKIYYWFMKGSPAGGSDLLTHPPYDLAIYVGNLSIIPAMVFFLVFTETDFSGSIRRFLNGLGTLPYTALHRRKLELMQLTRRSLWTLVLVQGVISIGLAFASPWLLRLAPELRPELWLTALGLAWLQYLVLSWFSLYFYFNRQSRILLGAALLLGSNIALTVLFHRFLPQVPDGTGAVLAHALTAIYLYRELMYTTRHADRIILTGNNR